MKPATILITIPKKQNDATMHTAEWADKAIKMARQLGYNVITLRGNEVTHDKLTEVLEKYQDKESGYSNIRLYWHFGHGCPGHLIGQNDCILTKKLGVDELLDIGRSGIDENGIDGYYRLNKILHPLKSSCPGICQLEEKICNPCFKETNIHLLRGAIIGATACHSGLQLARCAISHGVETYLGYNELFLFPVDSMRSQDITGEIQLELLRNLLLGKSVRESEIAMRKMEDTYIRMFKKIKYLSLPILWNQEYRTITGNPDARIYEGNPIFGIPIIPWI